MGECIVDPLRIFVAIKVHHYFIACPKFANTETIVFLPIEHTGAFTAWFLVVLVCLFTVPSNLSFICILGLHFLSVLTGPSFKKCLPVFAGKLVTAWLHRRKPHRDRQRWRGCW